MGLHRPPQDRLAAEQGSHQVLGVAAVPDRALDAMAEQLERHALPVAPPVERVELDDAQAGTLAELLGQPALARSGGAENNDALHLAGDSSAKATASVGLRRRKG